MKKQIIKISEKFRFDLILLDSFMGDIGKAILELNEKVDELKKYLESGGSIEVKPKTIVNNEGKVSIRAGIADNPSTKDAIIFALNNRIEQLQKYIDLSLVMSFTYLMTVFDAKYIDIMKTYFESISDSFPPEDTVEKKVMKFAYKSFRKQMRSLKDNYKIDFESILGKNVIESLIEIRETRNIHVHNSGIINKKYLDSVFNSTFTEGQYRVIDESYLQNSKELVKRFFNELTIRISSKMQ